MKKIYLILIIVVFVILLFFSGAYAHISSKVKERYINYFNMCKDRMKMPRYQEELTRFPQAQECIAVGGCFEMCGSGCGLPKPTTGFSEILDYFLEMLGIPRLCPDMCTTGCLYPIK